MKISIVLGDELDGLEGMVRHRFIPLVAPLSFCICKGRGTLLRPLLPKMANAFHIGNGSSQLLGLGYFIFILLFVSSSFSSSSSFLFVWQSPKIRRMLILGYTLG